jgi:hypothetical protein
MQHFGRDVRTSGRLQVRLPSPRRAHTGGTCEPRVRVGQFGTRANNRCRLRGRVPPSACGCRGRISSLRARGSSEAADGECPTRDRGTDVVNCAIHQIGNNIRGVPQVYPGTLRTPFLRSSPERLALPTRTGGSFRTFRCQAGGSPGAATSRASRLSNSIGGSFGGDHGILRGSSG